MENKGKLILTEIFPSVQKHDIFSININRFINFAGSQCKYEKNISAAIRNNKQDINLLNQYERMFPGFYVLLFYDFFHLQIFTFCDNYIMT